MRELISSLDDYGVSPYQSSRLVWKAADGPDNRTGHTGTTSSGTPRCYTSLERTESARRSLGGVQEGRGAFGRVELLWLCVCASGKSIFGFHSWRVLRSAAPLLCYHCDSAKSSSSALQLLLAGIVFISLSAAYYHPARDCAISSKVKHCRSWDGRSGWVLMGPPLDTSNARERRFRFSRSSSARQTLWLTFGFRAKLSTEEQSRPSNSHLVVDAAAASPLSSYSVARRIRAI